MKISKIFLGSLVALTLSSCLQTKDLAKTLRLSDNSSIDISHLNFVELRKMKSGKTCTYNFLFFPIFGDGSILTAANNGEISNVQLVGETGFWAFPIVKNCTIVYGDAEHLPVVKKAFAASN